MQLEQNQTPQFHKTISFTKAEIGTKSLETKVIIKLQAYLLRYDE